MSWSSATRRSRIKTVLRRRLENPDHCKIKLRSAGYRLVCRGEDARVTVVAIAVGKRERGEVYETARKR